MSTETRFGLRGWLIDAPEYGAPLRSWPEGALVIENGRITEVGDYSVLSKKDRAEPLHWKQSEGLVIFPGLIDLHSHIPQYPAVARGQSELLPWLREHIFPLEREFTGARAKVEAAAFFGELARHGTTTAMLYTVIYEDACDAAFAAAEESGLRAIMGKMMMDVGSYGSLEPDRIMAVSLQETERLCQKWHGAADGRLEYAVSPRFALSCTEKLMRSAAEIAVQYGTYIETHLSENLAEIELVKELFPEARDYTDVYDKCGLLTPRTVLGHCIHLSPEEREVLAARGSNIAHCPTANLFLQSGIMPLDTMRAAGLKIGLGTDVAAGPELNLWRVMRSAIESQKARSFYEADVQVPTPADVLHLATQGGADALGKGATLGSFHVGKEADLTIMDYRSLQSYPQSVREGGAMGADDVLSLCIYRGGPQAVAETMVRGQSVYRRRAA